MNAPRSSIDDEVERIDNPWIQHVADGLPLRESFKEKDADQQKRADAGIDLAGIVFGFERGADQAGSGEGRNRYQMVDGHGDIDDGDHGKHSVLGAPAGHHPDDAPGDGGHEKIGDRTAESDQDGIEAGPGESFRIDIDRFRPPESGKQKRDRAEDIQMEEGIEMEPTAAVGMDIPHGRRDKGLPLGIDHDGNQ